MMNNFKLSALAIILAIFSVQCSPNSGETPQYPTSIEDHFKAGTFIHEGTRLAYQEGEVLSTKSGKSPLVIMLHGQYANGSDNKSQLRHDAMIRLWHQGGGAGTAVSGRSCLGRERGRGAGRNDDAGFEGAYR